MKYIYLIAILFGISLSNAQEFYICDYNQNTEENNIKLIGPNFEIISEVTLNNFVGSILDIAYSPSGKIYGITSDQTIIEINLATGDFTSLFTFQTSIFYNNMVCNVNNELLLINGSQQLITFSLDSLSIISIEDIGDTTPGDLTFYKGNLIFQSAFSKDIVRFTNNQLTTVACGNYLSFFGFSNFVTNCGENLVYAFESGNVYQFDIESNTVEQVGSIFLGGAEIFGATSINEYLASACPLEELQEVNCDLNISDELLANLQIYPNPVKNFLYIQNLNFSEDLFFTLYSVEGKKLLSEVSLSPEIDLSELSSGVYLMNIYNKSKSVSITKKILKN